MEEMEKLFLQVPEPQEPVFGNAEGAEGNQDAEEGEIGVGIGWAVQGGEFKAALQAGDNNRRPVQAPGDVGEGAGGCAEGEVVGQGRAGFGSHK